MEPLMNEAVAVLESSGGEASSNSAVLLTLNVTDPEAVGELEKHPDGVVRDQYALGALRLGILALRQAAGQLDAAAIHHAGQAIVQELRELLVQRGSEIASDLTGTLRQYFDPSTGVLPQRIESLLRNDGDLERVLRQHIGPDSSTLAKTLESQLAPLFKLLSPDEAEGMKARIESMLSEVLDDQREQILHEFSLDNDTSALSRLVRKVRDSNGELSKDVKSQVETLIGEFSLDKPDSALSRLVRKVESAQALIGKSLTLDDETSPLSRLKRELQSTIDDFVEDNSKFQAEVRETLGRLQAQRAAEARSTLHGHTFEEQLGELINVEATRLNDVYASTGTTTGAIAKCKIGDFVTTLGPDSAAPYARIVWEAKSNKSYDLAGALEELDQARKNRQAQVGVFVFSRETAPAGVERFARYGNHVLIIWDPEDPSTDVYVKAAYSVARALVVRETHETAESEQALNSIELATRTIEKQIDHVAQIKTWAETIKSNGGKIAERAERMEEELKRQVAELDTQLSALKTESGKEVNA
jgi:division protein CdvB (Snf7/Vps24/ESCRT-III family)